MVDVAGTRQSFGTLGEWAALHASRVSTDRASRHSYARHRAIFHAMRPWMLLQSRDLDGLRRVLEYLRLGRCGGLYRFDACGHDRGWKDHWAALVAAAHNRIHQLETGAADRDRVRHGAPDPARMPDDALNRIIQTCRDMSLVDACRMERAKRLATH